jgi:hypothetical protein
VFKATGVICAAVLLAACGTPKPREELNREPPEAASHPNELTGAGVFRIDSGRSEVRLLVYRAGPMARLGHNHVIVNHRVGGWVKFGGNASDSSFFLDVPVADFVVDDARLRGEEGADFSDPVPDDAKVATLRNMLSAALLDGAHFPSVTLASVAVAQTKEILTATLAVSVAGHVSRIAVPFRLEITDGRLCASGTTTVAQSAVGLTPFSVMLGALQVQDEFTVKFKLIAAAS